MAGIGGAGFGARRYGAPPTSGSDSSIAPEPAWTTATVYNIDPTDGISRVLNVGNLYQCRQSGTSAASGSGPTGTGTNIADGTTSWLYLGPAPSTTVAAGSQILGILVRGNQASAPSIPPFDNASSGPYTTISNTSYGSFPTSFAGIFRRPAVSPAKTDFILTAQFGDSGGGGDGDELNVHWIELTGVTVGAPHASVSSEKVPDRLEPVTEPNRDDQAVGRYGDRIGRQDVRNRNIHTATPLNGLQIIPGATSLLATSSGYVQVGVAWRLATAGTFSEQWQTTGEGAIMSTVAYAVATSGITGSLSVTLAPATLASSARVRVSGAGNVTLAPAALAATAKVRVTGAASPSISPSILQAEAKVFVSGSLATTLQPATIDAAAKIRVSADLSKTLVPTTLQATGIVGGTPSDTNQGQLSVTLKPAALRATAKVSGIPAGMLELMEGGGLEIHPRIVGPIPNSPYEYLLIPQSARTKDVLYTIERAIAAVGFAERRDLITGARAYRVLFHTLWRLPSDANGYFIVVGPLQVRFSVNDPTLAAASLNDWAPV